MQFLPYVRWSSDKQAQGSSLTRQVDTITAYAAEKGWKLPPLAGWIRDEGVSAYKGHNMLPTAELGGFTDRVTRQGGHDIHLICEQLDRLSRKEPGEVIEWFFRVTNAGVTVVLCDNHMIINKASLRNQTEQLRHLLDDSERANAEVQRRSKLLRAAWDAMRDGKEVEAEQQGTVIRVDRLQSASNPGDVGVDIHFRTKRGTEDVWQLSTLAAGFEPQPGDVVQRGALLGFLQQKVHVSATCPGWLILSECRRFFEPNPETMPTLISIMEWYADGLSKTAIVRLLNERGDRTWRGADQWHTSSVKSIVEQRHSIGEYQHYSRSRGRHLGDPIPNYFPQVVSDELWQRANAPRTRKGRDGRGASILNRNLFADIARCAYCDQKMYFNRKTRKKGPDVCYLKCSSNHFHVGRKTAECNFPSWRYEPILQHLLNRIITVILDDQHFTKDDDVSALNAAIAGQKRRLGEIADKADNLAQAMAQSGSARLVAMLDALEKEEAQEKAALADLEDKMAAARGAVDPVEHIRRVRQIQDDMDDDDPAVALRARTTIKDALNDLVDDMAFGEDRLIVTFAGARRAIVMDRVGNIQSDIMSHHPDSSDPTQVQDYLRRFHMG